MAEREYTERVAEVVYAAETPLPDGYRDTWELSLKLPEGQGERLVFPVVQTCARGETAWIQTYDEGQQEPEAPAPFVELTAADAGGHHGDAARAEPAASSSSALGWVSLVVGALGLGAGATALARTRARS